jgi:hypothetical protein
LPNPFEEEASMQLVHVYLTFPGSTDEALELYQEVFGTKVVFRRSPTRPGGPTSGCA